ncbi:hypothetical protein [Neptunicella sp. SCSIO 80796]
MISQLDLLSILMVPVVAYLAGAIILTLIEIKRDSVSVTHSPHQDSQ